MYINKIFDVIKHKRDMFYNRIYLYLYEEYERMNMKEWVIWFKIFWREYEVQIVFVLLVLLVLVCILSL